ncbi:serralysin [Photorhabdus bodei]|uniref:serralysin n=1 Tax=Photorhabdus bodei TaxID=2029681 RepID=A0A329XEE4_9GAMM|nr:serralysin [Photorhabdus bodei]NDK98392.1 serralysin family metalloprotease [Photorhabdus bodei]NDL02641.1 serralysin family metalloprotease [Photorhabdus bodei]NDL06874.1 serralysin family metalloprotease [Photorhabdus bodei]RAX13453.1 serine 3-dehydrogenase [Photorhabdus bodei]
MSVKRKVSYLEEVSGSAKVNEILTWLQAYIPGKDPNIVVRHEPSKDAAKELIRSDYRWGHQSDDKSETFQLTYNFLESEPDDMPWIISGFSAFNEEQKAAAKLSIQSWADVANIKFTETYDIKEANITFGFFDFSLTDDYAFAEMPNPGLKQVGTWYNAESRTFLKNDIGVNGYGRHTFTHEIGHTLGLDHPADYDASDKVIPTYKKSATYFEDSSAYTVMGYFSEKNTGQDFKGIYSAAPLLNDISAIQSVYGANNTTRTDDTVYGFNSNTDRDFFTAKDANSKLVFTAWDAGGNDTFDFSGFTQDQRINLNEASFSDVGGLKGNISIARGVTIENAIGGSGNDILIGNDANNTLKGGAGDDIIYGGLGADHLWGGEGKDTFVYLNAKESPFLERDWIHDFVSGEDKIDVSLFDLGEAGKGTIKFVEEFTGAIGEAVISYDSVNKVNDFVINMGGELSQDGFGVKIVGEPLTESDFILS